MVNRRVAPYGAWRSPIAADLSSSRVSGLRTALDGEDVLWIESRAADGGRAVVVRRSADGGTNDVIPAPFNARSRVHEYGGGAFAAADGVVYFSNFVDQRLYRQERGGAPRPITPEASRRYADPIVDRGRGRLICVREDHTGPGEPVNELVALSLSGEGDIHVLASGADFYSSPRLSPDGARLAWLSWRHPNMPWDGSELWVGELSADGAVSRPERVAGGADESIFQPEWSPDGRLYFVSDRSGWWNLYRLSGREAEPLAPIEAEFGVPQWVFGLSTYAFESADRIVCCYTRDGIWRLAALDTETLALSPIETPYTELAQVRAVPGRVVFAAGSSTEGASVVLVDLEENRMEVLHRASEIAVDPGFLSSPRPIEFPTEGGVSAYGLFYAPTNREYAAPAGELPPLLVKSHGGPTSAATSTLDPEIQYWTSRGWAVLDVNYGGSTGYGRAYRRRLDGRWGIADVDDCVNGARFLVERGEVDGARLAIDGGSAGGYTTLCALTFHDLFRAGASFYGIGDLEALARETHKFESRYLDRLIGPYPERADLYRARSPIHYTDRLSSAIILLQGLDDEVVPPNQAERMFEAVRAKGLPAAYLPFEGEGHGFRRKENIKRAVEAEAYFLSRVFGFALADDVAPVEIENL